MRGEQWQSMLAAGADLYRFSPLRLSLLFGLMLVQRVTAGIGMLLLIPLLQLVGLDTGGGATGDFAGIIARIYDALGLEITLPLILFSYVAVVSLVALLSYLQSVMSTSVQQAYVWHVRHALYDALLHSSWQFFISRKMSDFVHGLAQQVNTIGMCATTMLMLLGQLVLVLVYVGLSLLISWQMTLLALGCGIVLLALLLPLNRRVVQSGRVRESSGKELMQMFTEHLGSLKMVKSYGSESRYLAMMDDESRRLERQIVRLVRFNGLTQLVTAIGGVVFFSLCFYFALQWLAIPLAALLLLLLIFSRLLPQVTLIQALFQRLLHQLPAFADVRQLMRECSGHAEEKLAADVVAPQFKQAISLENVSFRYANATRQVIDRLSLSIGKNETVALTGPSGAGKSTLADLIAGLLVPDAGVIRLDGERIEGERRLAWRRGIAYITQEVFLFHDTVRTNLLWVCPEASEQQLWDALETAAAADFVRALPEGLDTLIGDRGIRLSGGERQRLALARALLSKPQLLILDEATSALDHDNEEKIRQALQRMEGKLTILIIAHRESTIAHVKKRLELGRGVAAEAVADGVGFPVAASDLIGS
jgi:ATP-binding cassette subfamily C protein